MSGPFDTERTTIDGVPVKVGDVVWRAAAHLSTVMPCKLAGYHLGMWWSTIRVEIYSTERAALAGAIANQRKARRKAQQEVRRATAAIERLTARHKDIPR